jgi:hypothetical protein
VLLVFFGSYSSTRILLPAGCYPPAFTRGVLPGSNCRRFAQQGDLRKAKSSKLALKGSNKEDFRLSFRGLVGSPPKVVTGNTPLEQRMQGYKFRIILRKISLYKQLKKAKDKHFRIKQLIYESTYNTNNFMYIFTATLYFIINYDIIINI